MTYELAKQLQEKSCIKCGKLFIGANKSQRCKPCQAEVRKVSSRKWNKKLYEKVKDNKNAQTRAYQKTEQGKAVMSKTARKMKQLYPEKFKARYALNDAIKAGKIIRPANCELCEETTKLEAHHPDYSKALEVKWYCNRCHNLIEKPLSELIEACGEGVAIWQSIDKSWHASKAGVDSGYNSTYIDNDGEAVFNGSTPEEAVAKLWLELNKKNENA